MEMNNDQLQEREEIFHFTENVALNCHLIKKTTILIRLMGDYCMKSNFSIRCEH